MKIRWEPRATDDARGIWFQIAEDAPGSADAWLERLIDKFHLLARHPLLGRARDDVVIGVRGITLVRYVIFYRPIDGGVEVVRVLHSARDLQKSLSAR